MRRRAVVGGRWSVVGLLLVIACATARRDDLAARIDAILARYPQQTIAVSYYDFATRREFHRNEKVVFHAASTMKTPVMLGIFEAVSRGELRLDQPVRVRNEFVSIFDGSKYSLEAREDSDQELYDLIGTDVPLRELVRRMIVRSSNLATNIVIEFVGAPRVMALMKQIGANDIQVLRGVEDDKAYHAGMNNTTTSYDQMLIMRTFVSPAAAEMRDILLAQEHNDGIPAALPPGTRVAHKTGSITRISHDSALVFPPGRPAYVLVVLTRGFAKGDEAEAVIREVSRVVWEGFGRRGMRPGFLGFLGFLGVPRGSSGSSEFLGGSSVPRFSAPPRIHSRQVNDLLRQWLTLCLCESRGMRPRARRTGTNTVSASRKHQSCFVPERELTTKELDRAISSRLRKRLMSGKFESGQDIVALRRFVGLTQVQFALAMGISVHTLRNWEQGRRRPDGPAVALLRIAARHPRIIRENLGHAA